MGVGQPLVSASALAELVAGPRAPAVLDVRWELATGPQRDQFERGHIPGARFVDLDRDLAGPAAGGPGGRHPLPTADTFGAAMRRAGVDSQRKVVVYDAATSMAAARAWWLLRYFGHDDVAVLDGGLAAWVGRGLPVEAGPALDPQPGDFEAHPGAMAVLDAAGAARLARAGMLLDARAPERFRGAAEPIDPVAGHIPGARNRPTSQNVTAAGTFRPGAELRAEFQAGGLGADVEVGAYCGSGISAAHEILALSLAGISASLYPGSWSEWVSDPARPVQTGD